MKKILIVSVLAALAYTGCKKKESTVSRVVTASTPQVTITGPQYVSLHIGDNLPTFTAVAYDTFYRDSLPVVFNQAGFDNTTPGLYVISASAKNKYGYIGTAQVYVAVTEISDTLNLSGWYLRLATPGRVAFVTKKARGLFVTSNVGGVDTSDPTTGPIVRAVFAVTSPTYLTFGSQQVLDGGVLTPLTSNSESLVMAPTPPPPDTTLNYAIKESSFGSQVRTFVKQ
ncbi:MAG: hypothetical protein ACHQD8_03480 [Chitinophagales bacterium]